ncbi:MAG: glycosyltransferase family 4 protein [Planctomycetes bacterium]|nr:glycosyltransferase family 4 protein [Planctomycetota bacterium]
MHLVALVDSPDHVCCRYRLAAFRSQLRAAGHHLELRSFPSDLWGRLWLGSDLRHADAVILQRRLLPVWQLRPLRRRVRRMLFDLDDAVFLRDSYSPKGLHDCRRLRRFAATVRVADAVVAGNSYLADSARQHGGTARVIPTCVNPAVYSLAKHTRCGAGVQLVWIGSSSTLKGLEAITPLLETLGAECPGVRLKLVCDRFLRLRSLPVEECPWSEAGEAHALAEADVGIAWVPDDLWSRGKCGLKVLQYMAAGLPVVANPVGVQAEMVRHGETGFLAETPQEWVEAVRCLAGDPDLRRRMGRAARARVEAEFSVDAGAALWLELLEHLGREERGKPSRALRAG